MHNCYDYYVYLLLVTYLKAFGDDMPIFFYFVIFSLKQNSEQTLKRQSLQLVYDCIRMKRSILYYSNCVFGAVIALFLVSVEY